jgi:NADH-quinone oxidoreductase subunit C
MALPDGRPARGLSQDDLCARALTVASRVLAPADAATIVTEKCAGQAWLRLPRAGLVELMRALRDDSELAFDMLLDLTAVHFPRRPAPDGPFDVIYHLLSIAKGQRLRLKVACPDPEAGVASVVAVWPGADYMEREAYDMFGVRFTGHPNLKRILMPEEYRGFPMRKDFPYRGY